MGALPERNLTYPRLLFEKDPLAVSYCALAATLVSHPTPEIRYPAYKEMCQKMCHMANVRALSTRAYFLRGATREG